MHIIVIPYYLIGLFIVSTPFYVKSVINQRRSKRVALASVNVVQGTSNKIAEQYVELLTQTKVHRKSYAWSEIYLAYNKISSSPDVNENVKARLKHILALRGAQWPGVLQEDTTHS